MENQEQQLWGEVALLRDDVNKLRAALLTLAEHRAEVSELRARLLNLAEQFSRVLEATNKGMALAATAGVLRGMGNRKARRAKK